MAQIPAWPPASLPRLHVDQHLSDGAAVTLSDGPANYLVNVLRLTARDQVKLFDDATGEWLAELDEVAKKRVGLRLVRRLRERETVPDLWLLFAPIKRGRIDWLVEKATELGIDRMLPVRTRRTVVDRLNLDRLRAHAIEAAEQCERTALPTIAPMQTLDAILRDWPAPRALYFADEAGGEPLTQGVAGGPAAILIGPEGGFTDEERDAILALPSTRRIWLGPRILRADTAALAAISLWMGAAGDWKDGSGRSG